MRKTIFIGETQGLKKVRRPFVRAAQTLSASIAALSLTGCIAGQNSWSTAAFDDSSVAGDYLKARFAASQQQLGFAADAYQSAAGAVPQDPSLMRRTFFYELTSGDVSQATAYAEKLLLPEFRGVGEYGGSDNRPELALPQLTVAADLITKGKYDEAETALNDGMDSRFSRSLGYLVEAWSAYADDGLEAGLMVLDTENPDLFTGFTPLHRALMLDLEGKIDEAKDAYMQALSSITGDTSIIAYADFLERTSRNNPDHRTEVEELYEALAKDTGTLRRVGRLGLARLGTPMEGETRASLQQASRPVERLVRNGQEGAAFAFYNFAWASYEQIIREQAAAFRAGITTAPALNTPLAFAQLSTTLNQDLESAYYVIGAIYATYGLHEEAIDAFGRISFGNPFYEYAQMDIADAWVALERPERAVASLNAFVSIDGLTPEARLKLADLLAEDERFEEADLELTKAIEIAGMVMSEETQQNSLWRYYFARGATRIEADRWEDGIEDLQEAQSLSPDQPYVLNYLGYSWAERGVNLEEAFGMIERALELQPHSGAIVDSLGWAHYQLGDYDTAVGYLERAVALEPADPVITDHLGDAYWQTGRPIEARYEWRRALTFEPDADLQAAIERKLATEEVTPGASVSAEVVQ